MKLWARLSMLCVSALACLVMLAGCSSTGSVEEARSSRQGQVAPVVEAPTIHQDGVLKVAILTNAGTPEVMQDAQGTYWGLDVDVASSLAQQLGLAVELVPADSVKAALTTDADVILGVTSSDADTLTVVSAYMEEACGLFGRTQEGHIASVDELAGSTIGVVSGTEAEGLVAGAGLGATITSYPDIDAAFEALAEGAIDYVACPATEGAYLTFEYAGTEFAGALTMPVTVGAGVLSSNAKLVEAVQKALDSISSNGVLAILRSRWMGDLPHLSDATLVEGVALDSQESADEAAAEAGPEGSEVHDGAPVEAGDLASGKGQAAAPEVEGPQEDQGRSESSASMVRGDLNGSYNLKAGANAVTALI